MIKQVRLDERLTHGQVNTKWINYLGATHVVVVDDASANDQFQTNLLKMSIPENIKNYISWYYEDNGEDIVLEFGDWFNEYLRKHNYSQYTYRKMNYEEVSDALVQYKNDPAYVPPGQNN